MISIQIDETTKQALMSEDLSDNQIEVAGKRYILETPKAAGFKGVVWKGRDEWGTPVAIKFAITEDYEDRSYLQEVTKAKQLRGYPRFAELIDADIVNLHLSCGETTFVCFIEEWIDGDTLEVFLNNGKYSSTFLVEFVRMMSEALANLYILIFVTTTCTERISSYPPQSLGH